MIAYREKFNIQKEMKINSKHKNFQMTKGNFLTFQCIIYTHTHTHTHTSTVYPVFTKNHLSHLLWAKPHPLSAGYLLAAYSLHLEVYFHWGRRETSQLGDGALVNLDGMMYKPEMQFQPKIKHEGWEISKDNETPSSKPMFSSFWMPHDDIIGRKLFSR